MVPPLEIHAPIGDNIGRKEKKILCADQHFFAFPEIASLQRRKS